MNSEFGIVTIVQCRFGSSRLKGKALRPLAGRPMLEHVLERAKAIGYPVILATSANSHDKAVAKIGKKCGVRVFRGDEHDVLGRVADACREVDARVVVRITGDCPLLAPDVAINVLSHYVQGGQVIASNDTAVSGWPDGMDVEVFQAADLYEADSLTAQKQDREHVTPWLRRNLPHVVIPGPDNPLGMKLSIDTQADYDRVAAVFANLPKDELGWEATFEAARRVQPCSGLDRDEPHSGPPEVLQETASTGRTPQEAHVSVPQEVTAGQTTILPPAMLEALKSNGLTPVAAASMPDDELLRKPRIGPGTVKKLREVFP